MREGFREGFREGGEAGGGRVGIEGGREGGVGERKEGRDEAQRGGKRTLELEAYTYEHRCKARQLEPRFARRDSRLGPIRAESRTRIPMIMTIMRLSTVFPT